jgi:hypothetical protein
MSGPWALWFDRLDPGDAHDRIQALYEGALADYNHLKQKEQDE